MNEEKYSCKYALRGGDYSSEGTFIGTIEDFKKYIGKKFNKNLKLSPDVEFGVLVTKNYPSPIEVAGQILNVENLQVHTSKVEHGLEEIDYMIDSLFNILSYNKLKV